MKHGQNVVACDVAFDRLEELYKVRVFSSKQEENVEKIKLNVADFKEWQKAIQQGIKRFGKIDVLLNIAGRTTPNGPGVMRPEFLADIEQEVK